MAPLSHRQISAIQTHPHVSSLQPKSVRAQPKRAAKIPQLTWRADDGAHQVQMLASFLTGSATTLRTVTCSATAQQRQISFQMGAIAGWGRKPFASRPLKSSHHLKTMLKSF